jgi:hypothetical protein
MHLWKKEVSYMGFTLTPEEIKPGKNKLKAIQTAKAPNDVKNNPLFRRTVQLLPDAHQGLRSDRRSTVQPYPEGLQIQSGASARGSKRCLHQQLVSEPVMAFPWTD